MDNRTFDYNPSIYICRERERVFIVSVEAGRGLWFNHKFHLAEVIRAPCNLPHSAAATSSGLSTAL